MLHPALGELAHLQALPSPFSLGMQSLQPLCFLLSLSHFLREPSSTLLVLFSLPLHIPFSTSTWRGE
jgi:hypothetical protein